MNQTSNPAPSARQAWLAVLARSKTEDIEERLQHFECSGFDWLRQPEVGLVMLRARVGNTGQLFNLGEATVTRCTLRIATGEVGVGYVQGRDEKKAQMVAIADALLQSAMSQEVAKRLLEPLQEIVETRRARTKSKAGSTRVEFFTMVRGE